MRNILPHCDCPESSEALNLPVGRDAWKNDVHKMTQTETIRKSYCKYCGNFVVWKKEKKKRRNNENFGN